jgi:subtilisin family serine protease
VIDDTRVPNSSKIINMSLGYFSIQESVDQLIAVAYNAGILVVVAAGNNQDDACESTPGRAPEAITVAATTRTDTITQFSNFGPCVDVFAPGLQILSAWYLNDTNSNVLNGKRRSIPLP